MMLGYLIIGMLAGAIAAAVSLHIGSPILLALAVYSVVGIVSILICVATNSGYLKLSVIFRERRQRKKSTTSISRHGVHIKVRR